MLLKEVEALGQSIDNLLQAEMEYQEAIRGGDYNRFLAARIKLESAKIKTYECTAKFEHSYDECKRLQRMMG